MDEPVNGASPRIRTRRSLLFGFAATGAVLVLVLVALWAGLGGPGGRGGPSPWAGGHPGTGPAGTGVVPPRASPVAVLPPSSFALPAAPIPSAALSPPTSTPTPSPVSPAPSAPAAVPAGSFAQYNLPAPWVGGTSPWANIWVYTPAGYLTSSPTRYPVLYEVPWGGDGWESGIQVRQLLDTLIADGTLPPSLMVFINQARGPYRPSECADSADGREHFDSYVAQAVVPWVDAHFRTLRSPLARTLIGFSQGGYCAPTLLFHHPDLFANAVSFSGYFVAGVRSPDTRLAYLPFGGNATLIADDSPDVLAGRLPPSVRARLFLVLVGTPGEAFYGPQLQSFSGMLATHGYRFVVLDSPVGHSWRQVRLTFAAALAAVTQHQAQAGLVMPRG
jgi:predicted esterase